MYAETAAFATGSPQVVVNAQDSKTNEISGHAVAIKQY
jgi:hypothetical protein